MMHYTMVQSLQAHLEERDIGMAERGAESGSWSSQLM